jgi:N-hydroxyarylamine O-acetyltransferase
MADLSGMQAWLDTYLLRIGLGRRPAADATGLAAVQFAHRQAIGFENFDVRLGRGIALDPERLFAKLVRGQRGGYCFEHNLLFAAMLRTLGLPCRFLLARVWLGLEPDAVEQAAVPPRTHVAVLVDVGGEAWLADAGFGAGYLPPLPLADGASGKSGDGANHRLRRAGPRGAMTGEWVVERAGPASATDGRALPHNGWQAQYSFDLTEVAPLDLEQANYWTSTRPKSRFTRLDLASIVLPEGFASLNGRRLTIHHDGRADEMEFRDIGDYRATLADLFRIVLSEDEVRALGIFKG